MTYIRDIFYKPHSLSLATRKKIIREAFEVNFEWWVDDCPGWTRRRIEMSFEDIMKKFDQECHFVVIERRGFDPNEYKGEVGFCTLKGNDHYLWIHLSVENLNEIVKKYQLKPFV